MARQVVHRPEAPDDAPKPQLSREEILALATVTQAPSRSGWSRAARRGGIAIVPTAILSFALDYVIGWWSVPLIAGLAMVWTLRPLWRQHRDGWV